MVNKMQLFKIIVLIAVNLLVSILIQSFNLWHISNYDQELFRFGWLGLMLALVLGFILILKLNLVKKYPFLMTIIIVGVVSNILERLYFGYVTDYLDFGIGVVDLADLEIYSGCFCIFLKELV
jgi:lipoprotein signal peptidase